METPDNQIKVLERKLTDLSQLLVEWKNYEQIINMSILELRQLQNNMFEQMEMDGGNLEDSLNDTESNKQEAPGTEFNKSEDRETIKNENESEDSATESLFNSNMFKNLELEYESVKDKGVDLYGAKDAADRKEQAEVKFSEGFIDSVLPELKSTSKQIENLESLEELINQNLQTEDISENKVITDLLLLKLNTLENEQLTTRQKNKLRKMKIIIERLANVKIFNPNLLEKLVRIVN